MGTQKLLTAGGGGVKLTPASSIASDVTVQIPSQNCTLGVQGPAFSAYSGTISVSNATYQKVACGSENFDTNSNYDTANYRFTPTVAGYYLIYVSAGFYPNASTCAYVSHIYKNGASLVSSTQASNATPAVYVATQSLVYLNGSTDYVEYYVYQNSGVAKNIEGGIFQGVLVRSA